MRSNRCGEKNHEGEFKMICMHWWALAGFLLGIVTLIVVIVRSVYRNAFKIGYRAGALRVMEGHK